MVLVGIVYELLVEKHCFGSSNIPSQVSYQSNAGYWTPGVTRDG